jgi:hypothetical protein
MKAICPTVAGLGPAIVVVAMVLGPLAWARVLQALWRLFFG